MEAWDRYERAEKALESFDKSHDAKKKAIIQLAAILQAAGWGAVRFANPNTARGMMTEVRPDHEPINPADLEGKPVKDIVAERAALAAEREAALNALPESLRQKLRPFYDRRPR